MRDPKIDPQPGDVLRKKKLQRRVTDLNGSFVHCRESGPKGYERFVLDYTDQWKRWAKNAEVIHES